MRKKMMLGALTLLLITVGCAPATSQTSTSSTTNGQAATKGETITVVAQSGVLYNSLNKLGPDFEKETGIKVNVQEIGRDAYLQKVSTQLLGKDEGLDVALVLNNYVGQFAAGGQFEDLGPFMEKNGTNLEHFLPASVQSVKYKEKTYAMPLELSTMLLIYRKDLIPNPPKTWEEYAELAEKFTQSKNPQSPTEFGTTFQGKRGYTQPKEWYQYFWAMGGELFDKDTKPTLNSEAGVKALTFVVDNFRKHKVVPPDATTYEFPEVLSAFQNEKVAMAVEWNAAYSQLKDQTKSPKVFDKFAVTQVPDGVSFIHAWSIAINTASKKKEAAYKFISWVTNEGAKRYALAGGVPPVKSVLQDPELIKERPEFPYIEAAINRAKLEPNLPEWPSIQEMITDGISKALAGEKSPKDALDETNASIHKLLESRGYYKK
ncbi:sugar ABC transporter substrate-binding protein [Paenibacillus alkaliterrae]|uniref:ABC transporter substrate-binding protein n=1 Tax=Paenibacillus alkaliterrae TaxID=320909 RepID=UPI001F1F090B|nr:sugar ABC transporter substrate-binding protein [Paenibacillus alkaliterrae]MCF2937898.1 sugar ABC transporter substrate-binding protein [Paenibacillus alkaliterrae]